MADDPMNMSWEEWQQWLLAQKGGTATLAAPISDERQFFEGVAPGDFRPSPAALQRLAEAGRPPATAAIGRMTASNPLPPRRLAPAPVAGEAPPGAFGPSEGFMIAGNDIGGPPPRPPESPTAGLFGALQGIAGRAGRAAQAPLAQAGLAGGATKHIAEEAGGIPAKKPDYLWPVTRAGQGIVRGAQAGGRVAAGGLRMAAGAAQKAGQWYAAQARAEAGLPPEEPEPTIRPKGNPGEPNPGMLAARAPEVGPGEMLPQDQAALAGAAPASPIAAASPPGAAGAPGATGPDKSDAVREAHGAAPGANVPDVVAEEPIETPGADNSIAALLKEIGERDRRVRRLEGLAAMAEGLGNIRAYTGAQVRAGMAGPEPPFVAEGIRREVAREEDKLLPSEARLYGYPQAAGLSASRFSHFLPTLERGRLARQEQRNENRAYEQRERFHRDTLAQSDRVDKRVRRGQAATAIRSFIGRADMTKRAQSAMDAKYVMEQLEEGARGNSMADKTAVMHIARAVESGRLSDQDRMFWASPWGGVDKLVTFASKTWSGTLPQKMRDELRQAAQSVLAANEGYIRDQSRRFAHAEQDLLYDMDEEEILDRVYGGLTPNGQGGWNTSAPQYQVGDMYQDPVSGRSRRIIAIDPNNPSRIQVE